MNEEWKDIDGYPGYKVSTYGRVMSYHHWNEPTVLRVRHRGNGYLGVMLYDANGRCRNRAIHRLVAEAFIPNPDNLPEVNHINEDKHDNSVKNLEWISHIDNCGYGTSRERRSKKMKNHPNLSKCVLQLDMSGNVIGEFPSAAEAARTTNVCRTKIICCCNGTRKTSGGFKWRYA